MKKVFRSKYSWWMTSVMVAVFIAFPCIPIFWGFNVVAIVFSALFAAFALDLLIRTNYTVDGDRLKLKAGLYSVTIDIDKIKLVEHVKSITNGNSFAWSPDRLMIHAPKGYKYDVSPKDEQGFIDALKQINPQLKVL